MPKTSVHWKAKPYYKTFTKRGKVRVLRKKQYEKERKEIKKNLGIEIGPYSKYKRKVK